jgi:shikimate kinase/shikimate kinase/3-dehydroquinate synthase
MKSKENLVFLGMMGSGKSSIGSLVAKKLKLNFIDVDKEIEKELGISISKIFETKGEDYFRKFEEKITLKYLKLINCSISWWRAFLNKILEKKF